MLSGLSCLGQKTRRELDRLLQGVQRGRQIQGFRRPIKGVRRASHRQGMTNLHVYILGQLLRVRNDLIGNETVPPVIINGCYDGPMSGVQC